MKAIYCEDKAPHELDTGEWCYYFGPIYLCCPGDLVANLAAHDVKVADGVLTVSPSIEVRGGPAEYWHGFVENGVFLDVNKKPL